VGFSFIAAILTFLAGSIHGRRTDERQRTTLPTP
jgi:hypothetical protein